MRLSLVPADGMAHLPGPVMTYQNVQRQRCVWCGALIDEHDLDRTMVAVMPGEEPRDGLPGWPQDRWVMQNDGVKHLLETEDGVAPAESCMALLPKLEVDESTHDDISPDAPV